MMKHILMQVGDLEELNGVDRMFCKGRKTPLLIGSVRSNMGHPEPVSGLCSIMKVVIAMENGVIPTNLNFASPRENVEGMVMGWLKVHTKATSVEKCTLEILHILLILILIYC
jgi:fatty acid synthase